ncbi:hypothetical protein SAMN05444365_101601 [Micromonospora pattaloongensis]|uniref:CDP-diglyceride synthetase n=1 Tax=Micromonospora pattaloongensis TaxID=405436 RepID=A0A1H3GZY8_9ACTN|nr:hypothetical protein [Micromonospora pattaloongensis]SDY08074.1 hypothetical protein SAMN05444365_101601 [Micromonospora pattaloongensis]
MFPSTPPDTGRDPWSDGGRPAPPGPPRGVAPHGRGVVPSQSAAPHPEPEGGSEPGRRRERAGGRASRRGPDRGAEPTGGEDAETPQDEVEPVPIRRPLSVAIAGFAALLGIGLVFGAQTAGPGSARIPFAVVVFGVQVLFVLAWTMAIRPPALPVVAVISLVVAGAADIAAVAPQVASLAPLGYVAAAGFMAGVLGQLVRPHDRARATDSLGSTLLIMVGVVSFGTLVVLSRIPVGTQAIFVSLAAAGVALMVARLTDAVLPWPRLAPQVPRGAAGVVLGAMLGTLTSAVIGIYLVGFTPTSAAVVGLVSAGTAVLADLAVGYAEAGRQMAGQPPTMWVARHMQGPLGGFALAAPVAYAISVLFLGT